MTDPVTEPDETPESAPTGEEPAADEEPRSEQAEGPSPEQRIAELTEDLQRKQAEFLNYKRRVEDDRVRFLAEGKNQVLSELLTVLDDIGRADEHGELVGGFKAVADQLTTTLSKFGLEPFGEVGEPFDPNLHEAVFHAGEDPNVQVQSIAQVMRTGYRVGDRVLRPAVVGVVDPGAGEDVAGDAAEDAEPTEE